MPTSSFHKKFVIKTKKDSIKLLRELEDPEIINLKLEKNISDENKETLELLKNKMK